jgi:hypothetical protein
LQGLVLVGRPGLVVHGAVRHQDCVIIVEDRCSFGNNARAAL